ncbi:5-dehydro-2-deoxygluconokinase [Euzebya tangerina]|uniref:5-dehydro-2-deoxygluconokinase n=1 Tax=Euzebya tangerina TaxID=591198 RepID=UPI000E322443|nr:5-dehydro-2-deoxygluconokinase [Euzebya tangerina]
MRGSAPDRDQFDVITMGRVSMDLFSQTIGADMTEVEGFDAMIGGSPSNIAIGTARLGARVGILTAVGEDEIGRFVRAGFAHEGVATDFIRTVPDTRTGLAILAVQPPSTFPLTFYRENPADIHLSVADVDALPLETTRVLQLSGAALSRGTCAHATLHAGQRAASLDTTVVLDLDLRPDQWADPPAFGVAVRALLPSVDVAIGTEEEFHSALAEHSPALDGSALGEADRADLDHLLDRLHAREGGIITVLKRGPRGVTVRTPGSTTDVPGYSVEIANTVGAGDAFASGVIHGHLQGWSWTEAVRFGNACGAIEVTRHGCSAALPTRDEVDAFINANAQKEHP